MATEHPSRYTDTVRIAASINIVAGLWLIVSAFVFSVPDRQAALWNTFLVGVAVLVFAAMRAARPSVHLWLSWLNLVLGLWLIAAPLVLEYSQLAGVWNSIVVGVVVGAMALWGVLAPPSMSRTS